MAPELQARTSRVARRRPASSVTDMLQLTGLVLRLILTRGEERERIAHHVIHVASGRAQRRKPSAAARLALFLVLIATPRIAAAQADGVETPTEMFEPERGLGIPLSPAFILYNRTLVEGQYDSNIYNREENRTNDIIAVTDSNFRIATRLPRHEFELQAGVGTRRYSDISEENSETYNVEGRTFLDFAGRVGVRIGSGYERGYERRGTAGDQFATDRPVRFDNRFLEASIDRTGGILEVGLSGSIRKREYLDASINGVEIDLSHRDATVRRAEFQASYRLSPVIRLHARVGGNEVKYDRDIGTPRGSSGYSLLAGVRYEVTQLVDLTAAVGYMRQSFNDPAAKPVSGLNYRLEASWTPTPMWRVTASGERTVDASPLDNVPAIVRSDFDLRVQRALGDRMLVEASLAYISEDYRQTDRNDRRYAGTVNVQYRVTNNIAAVVGAGYRKQSGGSNGRNYDGVSVSAGIRVAL